MNTSMCHHQAMNCKVLLQSHLDLNNVTVPHHGVQSQLPPGKLTFVDFLPNDNSSYVKKIFANKTANYSALLDQANKWLQEHPEWLVKTVETIAYDPDNQFGRHSLYIDNARLGKRKLAVRIWLISRHDKQQPIQKLKVIDIIPKLKITGNKHELKIENTNGTTKSFSALSTVEFETIDEIIVRLNKVLSNNQYLGQIINIESLYLPVGQNRWSVDTELLEWCPMEESRGVLAIMRVHLNERMFTHQTVQAIDFTPQMETWNAPLAVPNLESFTNILKRASRYLKEEQEPYQFLSCKTIYCPSASSSQAEFVDSRRTFYPAHEWLKSKKFWSKFIRIYIGRPVENPSMVPKSTILNCKIFLPRKNETNSSDYEMMSTFKSAIEDWFTKKNIKILSVETEIIANSKSSISPTTLIDSCLHLQHYPCDQLVIFKVYINGHYSETK